MGMRGPITRPLELKLLDGTYRKNVDGPVESHIRPPGTASPVRELDHAAQWLWDLLVPQLAALGLATEIDGLALTDMVESYSDFRTYRAKAINARDSGEEALTVARWHRMAEVSRATFERLAKRFGLTPSDRARLHAIGETYSDDDLMVRQRK